MWTPQFGCRDVDANTFYVKCIDAKTRAVHGGDATAVGVNGVGENKK